MKNILRFLTLLLMVSLTFSSVHTPRAVAAMGRLAASRPPSAPTACTANLGWELILPDTAVRLWRSLTYATDHTLYMTTDQDVRRTTDEGDTWKTLFATTPYSEYLHISSMAWDPATTTSPTLFVVRNVGYDHGEVFRSTDDGLTWQTVFTAANTLLYDIVAVRDASDNLVVFVVGFSPDTPAVWRSTDGGTSWSLANTGLSEGTDFHRIFPSPNYAADKTLYLTGYGPAHRSTDGGDTWTRVSIPWVDIPREVVFSPNYATDHTLWMSYFFVEGSGEPDVPPNGIARSTNSGQTWERAYTGLPVDYLDGYILGLGVSPDYATDPALYAVERTSWEGNPSMLYRSSNGGTQWWWQGLAPATPKGLIVAERNLFFLPTIQGLYRLRNYCWEWVLNGDAELNAAWSFPSTPAPAVYSTEQAHGGARSIRLGIVGTTANQYAYSSARQKITLPAKANSAQLTVWLYLTSTEKQQAAFSSAMSVMSIAPAEAAPAAPSAGDAQYILIMDDKGNILQRLLWTLDNSRSWQSYTFDLSAYLGKSFWLHFGVYNDGVGGKTGMYVDDVSLLTCDPQPVTIPRPVNPGAIAEDFLVTDADGYQTIPALAYNPEDDEFLVVYKDTRSQLLGHVYAQRMSSDGKLLGNAFVLTDLTPSPSAPVDIDVAYLPAADRYLVVWSDYRNVTATPDVYGQLVDRNGLRDGSNIPLAVYDGGQVSPHVVAGADAFLVVWGNADSSTSRVQGQRVSGTGVLLDERFDISDGAGWAGQPDVAYYAAADRYIVVWSDARAADQDIYAQWVTAAGIMAGSNISVTTALNTQAWPRLAATTNAVLVVWEDSRAATATAPRNIYGRHFAPASATWGPEIAISTHTADERTPIVAVWETATDSTFFVVWQIGVGRGDLWGQRVTQNGLPFGSSFVVSDNPYTQANPALAMAQSAPQPTLLAVWEDYRAAVPGVYGQRLDAAATKVGLHSGLTPLDGQQVGPVMAYSATSDRYLVAWYEFAGPTARIRAYTLDGDGTLPAYPTLYPITITTGIQMLDLALDAAWDAVNDRFMVVWSDIVSGTVDDFDIFGQLVAPDGNLVGDKLLISSAPNQQHEPSIAFSPEAGRYLVVFENSDPFSQTTDLGGQFLSAAGMPLLTAPQENFLIASPGPERQARYPDVAYDAAGRTFLTVWQDNRQGVGGWDVYGRQIDAITDTLTATLLTAELPIAAAADHFETLPRLAAGPAGHYLIVWEDTPMEAGGVPEVRGRLSGANGTVLSAAVAVAALPAYAENAPAVAYNAQGRTFLVAWHSLPVSAGGFASAIYARQLSDSGIPTTGAFPIAEDVNSARHRPVIAARQGHAEWLIAWEDGRTDRGAERMAVYARRQQALFAVYLPVVLRNKR